MAVNVITGNIFTTKHQTLVNAVNCVGVMGAGIALEYRLRYPLMYEKYVKICEEKKLDTGLLWIYQAGQKKILNFPTKKHWRNPSRVEYIHAGMSKFVDTYKQREIESIAFPLLGADKGGLSSEQSLDIMLYYLEQIDISVEIYLYDPKAHDDLLEQVKQWASKMGPAQLKNMLGIRSTQASSLLDALISPDVFQVNQLMHYPGIGEKTLEKLYAAFFQKPQQADSLF